MEKNFYFIALLILTISMLVFVFKVYLKNITTNKLVKIAIVAALYALLTINLAPISYGFIQFRLSEVMVLLAFIDPLYIPALVLGCIMANIFSPLGMIDVFVGSFATLLSVYMINRSKNLFLASLWPCIMNGIFVAAELYLLNIAPFWASILYVALGEFGVVSIIGVPLFKTLLNNNKINTILKI